MKTKNIISACFAGLGIYLLLTGSMVAVFSLSMLNGAFRDLGTAYMVVLQVLALCMPFITGGIFLIFAPKFSLFVCRFSKIEDDSFTAVITPEIAITVACVVTGITLAVQKIPEFAQFAIQQLIVSANPVYSAANQSKDFRVQLIGPSLYIILSMVVIFKSRVIARRLVAQYENH